MEAKDLSFGIEREEEPRAGRTRGDVTSTTAAISRDIDRVDLAPSGGLLDLLDESSVLDDTDMAAEEQLLALDLRPDVTPGRVADGTAFVVTLQIPPPVRAAR